METRNESVATRIVYTDSGFCGVGFISFAPAAAGESIALQLKSLTISAVTEKNYLGRITATPYMEVVSAEALKRACGRLPRILDVIVLAFEEKPLRLVDPVGDLMIRQDKLHTLIEDAVGRDVFKALYMIPGSKSRAEGTEAIAVDGGFNDCQPIKVLPWKVGVAKAPAAEQSATGDSASQEMVMPSPLSEIELAKAEAELMGESPAPKSFPGAPVMPTKTGTPIVMIGAVLVGLGGLMLVIGSYVGYQVAKIRRERRRVERRKLRKDRRLGKDRRIADAGPPTSGERRFIPDRRETDDRRKDNDRQAKRDRRDEK